MAFDPTTAVLMGQNQAQPQVRAGGGGKFDPTTAKLVNIAPGTPQTGQPGGKITAGQFFLKNLPNDLLDNAIGLAKTVINPTTVVEGIRRLISGGVQKLNPNADRELSTTPVADFASIDEALGSNLPEGSIITVNGQKGRIGNSPIPEDNRRIFTEFAKEKLGEIQHPIASFLRKPVTMLGDVTAVAGGAGGVMRSAGKAAELPGLVRAGEIAQAPMNAAAGLVGRTAGKVISPIATAVTKTKRSFDLTINPTTPTINRAINAEVAEAIEKAVRPSVYGKQTSGRMEAFYRNATDGVKAIVNNKDNLALIDENGLVAPRLPQSVSDMAQAIEQTKDNVWAQATERAAQTGDAGFNFNATATIRKLEKASKDLSLSPKVREYAAQMIPEIEELHGANPLVIQARIKELNGTLGGYYAGRVEKAKASVDASVAAAMRDDLDAVITKATGPGYQDLRNLYGSLKSMEKDVNNRANVLARQNPRGFFDLTDIFSGGKLAHGIITGNPALIAEAGAMRMVKNFIKAANNPDKRIAKMFTNVESLMNKDKAINPAAIPEYMGTQLRKMPVSEQPALPAPREVIDVQKIPQAALPDRSAIQIGVDKTYGEGFTMRNPRFADYIRNKKVKPEVLQDRAALQGLWEEFNNQ